jgi:hypothetical protein
MAVTKDKVPVKHTGLAEGRNKGHIVTPRVVKKRVATEVSGSYICAPGLCSYRDIWPLNIFIHPLWIDFCINFEWFD